MSRLPSAPVAPARKTFTAAPLVSSSMVREERAPPSVTVPVRPVAGRWAAGFAGRPPHRDVGAFVVLAPGLQAVLLGDQAVLELGGDQARDERAVGVAAVDPVGEAVAGGEEVGDRVLHVAGADLADVGADRLRAAQDGRRRRRVLLVDGGDLGVGGVQRELAGGVASLDRVDQAGWVEGGGGGHGRTVLGPRQRLVI